jgi:hypothetical protein
VREHKIFALLDVVQNGPNDPIWIVGISSSAKRTEALGEGYQFITCRVNSGLTQATDTSCATRNLDDEDSDFLSNSAIPMAMAVQWSSSGNPRPLILFHDKDSKSSWLHSSAKVKIVKQLTDKVFFNAAVMTGWVVTPTSAFGEANQGFLVGFAQDF